MHPDFQRLLQDATRLTRSGDLRGATAAIHAALNGAVPEGATAPRHPALPGEIVVDVEARELPSQAPANQVGQGQFISGRFDCGTSAREYMLFIPPHAGDEPLPLVMMLHGCTQNPADFAAGTRMNEAARTRGCYVLYPAQSRKANPQGCWNWFKHSHQARGRGEPALLAGMTREVMARHRVDPARVFVAGLSAGGAMAAILGETYPELFAAVGVHSGLAAGAAGDLPSALAAMRSGGAAKPATATGRPTIVFHGDADATVHPSNGAQVVAASVAGATQVEVERVKAPSGRSYTRQLHRAAGGKVQAEHWVVHGAAHAWSGGSAEGSYTDGAGPDASGEMLRFFLEHPRS
ncbi:PHB depolymerase family esterase [Ramlibacter sp.]|uniref:extracellular catalytic domain type 1 short-chain-length polyhydroxyalkanoate depolymerase n=1 Tax=Ramlibacter sp. TaxID=1917967 RepID=UPI002608B34F|nr:PHB depolymerase family esterase [Ramlibacter sp.]MDB5958684.1 Esterase, depolymerase [Ramlibacter sp.]